MALLRPLLWVPYALVSIPVSVGSLTLTVLTWCLVVILGRVPRGVFDLQKKMLCWEANYCAFLYLLSDRFEPLSFRAGGIDFGVRYPQGSSRLLAFGRTFTLLPGYLAFLAVSYVHLFLLPVSWLAVIGLGRHPANLFQFHEGAVRWYLRLSCYMKLLTDEYPPYSMRQDAAPSSNTTAFIMGFTIVGAFCAVVLAMFGDLGSMFGRSHDDRSAKRYVDDEGYVYYRSPFGGFSPATSLFGQERSAPGQGEPDAWWGDGPLYSV
jgi:hypothetical protein